MKYNTKLFETVREYVASERDTFGGYSSVDEECWHMLHSLIKVLIPLTVYTGKEFYYSGRGILQSLEQAKSALRARIQVVEWELSNEKLKLFSLKIGRLEYKERSYRRVYNMVDNTAVALESVLGDNERVNNSNNFVPVIFRRFEEGDIIAFFPTIPGTSDFSTCLSYMHIGQHCSASVSLIRTLGIPSEEEYKPLLQELRQIYEGDQTNLPLIVFEYAKQWMHNARAENLAG